jgi:putative transcriptional regulator
MDSLKGSFLIASPGLSDPNFARTVVFMVEHNDDGAFGLILSRPSPHSLEDICKQVIEDQALLPPEDALRRYPIFLGGPVQTSAVFFLHTVEHLGNGKEGVQGIFLGSQSSELEALMAYLRADSAPPPMRFFFGYSGWAAGQLEKEIRSGGWLIRAATPEQVFDAAAETLWNRLIVGFGGDLSILGMMPPKPELN